MTTTELDAPPRALVEPEPPARGAGADRARRAISAVLPAVIHVGVQQFTLMVLSWLVGIKGGVFGDALESFDGDWFLAIADGGYDRVPTTMLDAFGNHDASTPLAFFPGYPKVVGLVAALGLDSAAAGLVVSTAAGIACAYALARMGELVPGGSRRVGLVLVTLFAGSPMAITLSMVYSEALFCAFAAWALVFTLRREWVYAGVLCACAGLVRTTGTALVVAIGLAALVAVVRREDGWRPWVGGLVAPLGLLGYLGFVAHRTGELNGWFALQERGWHSRFDWGAATAEWVLQQLTHGTLIMDFVGLLLLVASAVLAVLLFAGRMPLPVSVYGALVLVMTFGSNGIMASKIRLMVPAFTLLIPIAVGLAKRRPSTVLLVLAGVVLVGSWFGPYALTLWGYAF